jgi:hypothetical protein
MYPLKLLLPLIVLTEGTNKKAVLSAAIIGMVMVVFSQLDEGQCTEDTVSVQISSDLSSNLRL